jgi:hypothetical protein
LLLRVDDIGREIDVQQGRVRRQGAGMLVLVAMGGQQVRAILYAIDSDFAAGAAAHGADRFALSGTEPRAFALLANGTDHTTSGKVRAKKQNTPRWGKKPKQALAL